jgi:hypothetical protein
MELSHTARKRHWSLRTAKWAVILMLGFAYTCLFGEVFLRVMDPQLRMPRFITGTDYGVRGNVPNSTYRQVTPEVDVEMRINAQGMRSDQDYTLEKPANTCRIALMGDSYFMGYEAHYEDTIAFLLEQRLGVLGYNVEVLNFAVSGFSTEEMLRAFEARTVLFDPDIVVSQFGAGDFEDNMRPQLYRLDEDGTPQPTNGTYLPGVEIRDFLMQFSFYRMLINNSHLYSGFREWVGLTVKWILTELGNLRSPSAPQEVEVALTPTNEGPSVRQIQTRYTSALLDLSRERAEAFGMEWFMFEVPVPLWKEYVSSVAELELDPATASRVISPIAQFDAHPRDELWLFREQGHSHFSETGHSLSTDALIDGLMTLKNQVFAGCTFSKTN